MAKRGSRSTTIESTSTSDALQQTVLNVGLDLAMEFGEHWLAPIQPRLAKHFPELTREELDAYDRACREAMDFGHAQLLVAFAGADGSDERAFQRFGELVRARFAWVDDANLSHLFSQGRYYAWKDGALP